MGDRGVTLRSAQGLVPRADMSHVGPLLVTGGGGFVGRNLSELLTARGYEVFAPRRAELDLRDQAAVERYLRRHRIEAVVHAAGKVGGIVANMQDPVSFYVENSQIGVSVVRAADAVGIERLVNLSSSCVYPKDRERLAEKDLLTGPFEPTNEGYALAKVAVGRLCEWISAEREDRLYRTLFPCNLYGPYDHFEGEGTHVVGAVLHKVHTAVQTRARTIEIWGDGLARREFMHVHDLCDAIAYLLPRLEQAAPRLNVGPGVDHTIREYYEIAARAAGWSGEFVHDLSRPVGMRRKLLDVSKLASLGWSTRIGLEEGVRSTYEWYADSRSLRAAA
jgi:GDP-L-fucose synthase